MNFEYPSPKKQYTWKNGWKIRVSIWKIWMCDYNDCYDDFKSRRLLNKHKRGHKEVL